MNGSKQHDNTVEGGAYILSLAQYVKRHEDALARYFVRPKARTAPSWSTLLTLGVLPSEVQVTDSKRPFVLKFDPHHLYYLLLKFEELAIPNIGPLDVEIDGGATRPMSVNYGSYPVARKPDYDHDDASSLRSTWSSFSVGSKWWSSTREQQPRDESQDVRFLYSTCTKLPAIKLAPFAFTTAKTTGNMPISTLNKPVKDFQDCPPTGVAVSLYPFKNLQALALEDLDPRAFIGWDVLSIQLRSLEVRRGGIEDVGELICDAVVEDIDRRSNDAPSLAKVGTTRRKRALAHSEQADDDDEAYPVPPKSAWSQLQHLSLAENSLTFVPTAPLSHLAFLTSLDLSSNLLIAVPPGLSQLTSLRSLNLSDNMIDSLLHVSRILGAVTALNLRNNRIDNLAGLERLLALERLDLRSNRLRESSEVGRLSTLPFVRQVWVDDNPFLDREDNPRFRILSAFAQEGNVEIAIDGSAAGMNERRLLAPLLDGTKRSLPNRRVQGSAGPLSNAGRREVSTPSTSVIKPGDASQQDKVIRRMATSPSLQAGPSTTNTTSSSSKQRPQAPIESPVVAPKVVKRKNKKKAAKRIVDLDGTAPSLSVVGRDDDALSSGTASDTVARPAVLSSGEEEDGSGSGGKKRNAKAKGGGGGARHARYATDPSGVPTSTEAQGADDMRARIERLRDEVGESWLTVLNERQQQQRQAGDSMRK